MPTTKPTIPGNDPLSVSQLNRLAKQLLEDCFPRTQVVGELSNLARPSSGHWYFTLKDERAQIRCAMFRSRNMAVRFTPEAGQQLLVTGKVSLYEGRGDYQLIVDSLEPAGSGALAVAFERLKQELLAAGWFDAERKKPLPETIRHVAVVTSPTGAAIRDVLSVLARRWPAMRVSILPAQVQGDAAAAQIVDAIGLANRLVQAGRQDFDLILATRGGGSLEDLWPFNERSVAQAIFDSELPVVSAVGHEVDTSIADFVADVRAPTPSAAAELISPDRDEASASVAGLQNYLLQLMRQRLQHRQQHLLSATRRLRHPGQQLRENAQRLDERELQLRRAIQREIQKQQERLRNLRRHLDRLNPQRQLRQQAIEAERGRQQLIAALKRQLQKHSHRLEALGLRLKSLSPEGTLQRGYALVTDSNGRLVTDSRQLSAGEQVKTRVAQGSFVATVDDIENV